MCSLKEFYVIVTVTQLRITRISFYAVKNEKFDLQREKERERERERANSSTRQGVKKVSFFYDFVYEFILFNNIHEQFCKQDYLSL